MTRRDSGADESLEFQDDSWNSEAHGEDPLFIHPLNYRGGPWMFDPIRVGPIFLAVNPRFREYAQPGAIQIGPLRGPASAKVNSIEGEGEGENAVECWL